MSLYFAFPTQPLQFFRRTTPLNNTTNPLLQKLLLRNNCCLLYWWLLGQQIANRIFVWLCRPSRRSPPPKGWSLRNYPFRKWFADGASETRGDFCYFFAFCGVAAPKIAYFVGYVNINKNRKFWQLDSWRHLLLSR